MQTMAWVVLAAIAAALAYAGWQLRKRWVERSRAAAARAASFLAQAAPTPAAAALAQPTPAQTSAAPDAPSRKDNASLPQQKLLFEAAAKAAEAGEPVLSIQLYARLLARYPDSGFADQVRAAVEGEKKKLAKG
jgi:hypothetical protein